MSPSSADWTSLSSRLYTGCRFVFWLQARVRAFSDRGYWSGVAICFSIRQPMTRASSGDNSTDMAALPQGPTP